DYLSPVDKLHLADGNFVLQPILLPIVNGQRPNWNTVPPQIKIKSVSTENEVLNIGILDVRDPSLATSYSSIYAQNLELGIGSTSNLTIRAGNSSGDIGNIEIEAFGTSTISSKKTMSLQPSTGTSHGDLIIYDQSSETTDGVSVGQIAIGHNAPRHWLDIHRLEDIRAGGLESWDSDGEDLVDPFMVNFQNGVIGQIKLLHTDGVLLHGITTVIGDEKLIDIKNPDDIEDDGILTEKKIKEYA
ncbi:uncharacterized protein METZ01_LOCUS477810, partial [marine metagenome]